MSKRKHSPSPTASDESVSSSVATGTEPDMQKKRKQSPSVGSAKNAEEIPSVQGPSTSGEGQSASSDSANAPDCPICLESIGEKEVESLACAHVFHSTCINEWLVENRRCPACRHAPAPPQNARTNDGEIGARRRNGGNGTRWYNDRTGVIPNNRGNERTMIINGREIRLYNDGTGNMLRINGREIRLDDEGIGMRQNFNVFAFTTNNETRLIINGREIRLDNEETGETD